MACGVYTFPSKVPTEPNAHPETDVVEYTIQSQGLIWANAKSYAMGEDTAIHMPAVASWYWSACRRWASGRHLN